MRRFLDDFDSMQTVCLSFSLDKLQAQIMHSIMITSRTFPMIRNTRWNWNFRACRSKPSSETQIHVASTQIFNWHSQFINSSVYQPTVFNTFLFYSKIVSLFHCGVFSVLTLSISLHFFPFLFHFLSFSLSHTSV